METLYNAYGSTEDATTLLMFLMNISIKSTGLLVLVWLLTQILRRRSAATRHLIWNLALVSILLLPVFSLLLPAWRVRVMPEILSRQDLVASKTESQSPLSNQTTGSAEIPVRGVNLTPADKPTATPSEAHSERVPEEMTASQAPGGMTLMERTIIFANALTTNLPRLVLFIWAVGAGILLIRQLLGRTAIWWIARQAREIGDPSWSKLSKPLLTHLGIRRQVKLLQSKCNTMPMTWGAFRPKVMLPAEAVRWPQAQKRFVLLHELAHIKRWDALTQLLAQLASALYWFNPFIWFAHRQLLKERERACDDFVLTENSKPSEYASLLLEIARSPKTEPFGSLAVVTMARSSQLEGRMLAILDPHRRRGVLSRLGVLITAGALISLVLPLAAMRPQPRTSPVKSQMSTETAQNLHVDNLENPERQRTPQSSLPKLSRVDSSPQRQTNTEPSKTVASESPPAIELNEPEETLEMPKVEPQSSASARSAPPPIQDRKDLVVRSLSEALRDSSVEVRLQAARTLGDIRSRGAVQALMEALNDENWRMRETVARALGQIEDPMAVKALGTTLKDPNRQVRQQTVRALGEIGDKTAVDALTGALQDEDAEVRGQAAWALGQIRDPRAAAVLGAVLKDENREVRKQAIWALGEIDDRSAVEPLMVALDDQDWEIRQKAAWALGQIDDPAAVPPLTSLLQDENWEVRKTAVWALGEISDRRAVGPLSEALKDSNWEVRKAAARALGEIDDPSATRPLRSLLSDPNREVRRAAVWALGQIQDAAAIEPLGQALKDDDWEIRKQAAWALGHIDDPVAVDGLSRALHDDNSEVRKQAVWALGEIDDRRAVPPLTALINDPDWEVRRQTVWALGEIQDPSAVAALGTAVKDENREVRKMALWALGEIRDRTAVEPLIVALRDEDWEIRNKAVWALGQIGDPRALEPLTAALKDVNQEVRKSAARALGELKWRD